MGPFSFEEACALHGVHLRIYIGASLLGLGFLILRHVFLDREAKKKYRRSNPMLADQMPTGKRRFTADNGL